MNIKYFLLSGLCPDCSRKLNYHSKKREIKKLKKLSKKSLKKRNVGSSSRNTNEDDRLVAQSSSQTTDESAETSVHNEEAVEPAADETAVWSEHKPHDSSATIEQKSREEEFDDYLEDLLL